MQNTIQLPFAAADPYILRASDGCYYLYCTCEDFESSGGFPVYMSKDLHNWTSCGKVLGSQNAKWGINFFWAPECFEINGKYYLFYSANWKENPNNALENFRIGVAISDSPTGPFSDLYDRPILDPGYPIIDADVYYEDGHYYLYYSRCCYEHKVGEFEESWIYGVELKPDFSGLIGEPVLLLRPEQEWEGKSIPDTGRRWNEGSYIFKHEGKYYITYSSNYFVGPDYAVGYATADHPLGPFTKAPENPILERGGFITGTGHSCMFYTNEGQLMICYHGRTESTGQDRIGFISPAHFSEDGKLVIDRD